MVWKFGWQDEPEHSVVQTDSDGGGTEKDRKSTSGGVWMLGDHCCKTWCAPQGAYALSSAEVELYGMVEGATRAKRLVSLARELGFRELRQGIWLGTDSTAAKSFVCRRGLGRMRHLQVRDLWLQKEVRDGNIAVYKVPGITNPADLMTTILGIREIGTRLEGMGLRMVHAASEGRWWWKRR